MGGKTSTSSSSGGNNNNNNNNNQANQIANQVKKDIGFSQTKHPTEGIVNTYAFKDGKKMKCTEVKLQQQQKKEWLKLD